MNRVNHHGLTGSQFKVAVEGALLVKYKHIRHLLDIRTRPTPDRPVIGRVFNQVRTVPLVTVPMLAGGDYIAIFQQLPTGVEGQIQLGMGLLASIGFDDFPLGIDLEDRHGIAG